MSASRDVPWRHRSSHAAQLQYCFTAFCENPIAALRAPSALRLDEALLAPATTLTTEQRGITVAVMQTAGGDCGMAGKISFSYRGKPWCSFGFELSPQ